MPMGAFNVWRIQIGRRGNARYDRDWYHAVIVSLNQTVIISSLDQTKRALR